MQVYRAPAKAYQALQYHAGQDHPFVTIDSHGQAMTNNQDYLAYYPTKATPVDDGDWVVRAPGMPDQVFNELAFHQAFVSDVKMSGVTWLGAQIDDLYREMDRQSTDRYTAPLSIVVAGWPHTGKTLISSFIEAQLRKIGFSNIQVHEPEEPPHRREALAHETARLKDDPTAQQLLDKAITIYEVTPPPGKRRFVPPKTSE